MNATATAPDRQKNGLTVLYDGHCRFCTAAARRLAALGDTSKIAVVSLHEPGVLERFPSISHEAAMERLHVVDAAAGGRVYAGAAAVARVLRTSKLLAPLAALYAVPGLHGLADALYDRVAENRYRISGRTCDDGACKR